MTQAPWQISYAIRPRSSRRMLRRGVAALVLCTVGLAAWLFGPPAYMQAEYLITQHRLMNAELPPGKVVLSLVPSEVQSLLNQGYLHVDVGAKNSAWYADGSAPSSAGYRSPLFASAGPYLNMSLMGAGVFMHSRCAGLGGQRRLLILETYLSESSTGARQIAVRYFSCELANWSLLGHVSRSYGFSTDYPFPQEPTRVYAGQVDSNDGSAFDIPFDTASGRSNLHGALQMNGSIEWQIKTTGAGSTSGISATK